MRKRFTDLIAKFGPLTWRSRDNCPLSPAADCSMFSNDNQPALAPPLLPSVVGTASFHSGHLKDGPARSHGASIPLAQGAPGKDAHFSPHKGHFAYAFALAKSSLLANGILSPSDAPPGEVPPVTRQARRAPAPLDMEASIEPVAELGIDKARLVLAEFTDTILPIWPCVDLSVLQQTLDEVFRDCTREPQDHIINLEPIAMSATAIDTLKAALGISMLVNGEETAPLARHLPRYLDWSIESIVMGSEADIPNLVLAVLLSLYHLYRGSLLKAWRTIGAASKACFELGMHQTPAVDSQLDSSNSPLVHHQTLFCCIFVIDRRCSFGLGLPYAIHLEDIDEKRLQIGPSNPYLAVMAEYDCITSEILPLVSSQERLEKKVQQHAYFLEFQLHGLRDKFESFLTDIEASHSKSIKFGPRLLQNMRISLTARVNHARSQLRLSQIQASGGVKDDPVSARIVTDAACETISVCASLIRDADVLGSLRINFDFFICAALATLLTVVSQQPELYGDKCRDPFHEALDSLATSKHRLFNPRKNTFTFDQLREIAGCINMSKRSSGLLGALEGDGTLPTSLDLSHPFSAGECFASFPC
ncbi:uncharacterized protein A1O9_09025 [Exophiala aquamarina CBS 119918]|uniref:Xylanolytic transcriptional activator regulatory domain-containing protein n=1 Tax=Exophiala aquamarina CBS 119918 TaxID=1182545 RepID=A0A072P5M1_9EURO|nr:uncharacterized protein A1O9_09025 [Exophiala aquamarina CBS 119918]KEF54583.1 hypothetical protein A1O9_09025 [Exophiala aquamarina CBS 119918]